MNVKYKSVLLSFSFVPKFALGVAHEYGMVWGMDWCPSGTTDLYSVEDQKSFTRLGLLAIACSNGYAYILPVPYPSSIIDRYISDFLL